MTCSHCGGSGTDGYDEYGDEWPCAKCDGAGGLCDSCGEPSEKDVCDPCGDDDWRDNERALDREYERNALPSFGTPGCAGGCE